MKDLITKLKTILIAKDFVVTGSYTLSTFGLFPKDSVADLDLILVEPEASTIETLNRFMTEFPAKTTESLKKLPPEIKTPCKAIFMYDKVKVDVFVINKFSDKTIVIDGVKHTTIDHIVQAKKSYGRMKDWLQLRDMARIFFKDEEFTSRLNNGWKEMLRSSY